MEDKTIKYVKSGEYLLPDLTLGESGETYGKYGMLRKTFLKEHREGTYDALLMQGKLTAHLAEIDRTAQEQVEQMIESMKAAAGVTEELKAQDMTEWVGRLNALKNQAEEVVLRELIYQ
ncbi:MAG: TnpV protein [Pseudoflavonifractor sp.]|nr:TnpV protein [Pseudoflavonifractor sp.]